MEDVQQQVEYYFSDKNLQKDQFFHKQLSEAADGFIDLAVLLCCNKIKQKGIQTVAQLQERLQASSVYELSADKSKIRKKQPLPDLIVKKVKTEQKPAEFLIFGFKGTKEVQWKTLANEISKQFGVAVHYARCNKDQGNFALDKAQVPQELQDKIVGAGISIGDENYAIELLEAKELEAFNRLHGRHLQGIVQKNVKSVPEARAPKENQVTFLDKQFPCLKTLKNVFRNLLSQTADDEVIGGEHAQMLAELVKFHPKQAEKMKDFKHFTTGVHPEHKYTRCFFVVKLDGAKEDFSVFKCLDEFEKRL